MISKNKKKKLVLVSLFATLFIAGSFAGGGTFLVN